MTYDEYRYEMAKIIMRRDISETVKVHMLDSLESKFYAQPGAYHDEV